MKNLFFYTKYIFIISIILCNFLILTGKNSDSLDFAPSITSTSFEKIANLNKNSVQISTTFSTRNVVNNTNPIKFSIFNPEIVPTTSIDAGSGVKRYQNMLYAHSNRAFNPIKSLSVGDKFSVLENGITSVYQIDLRKVYSRDVDLNGSDSYHNWFRYQLYNGQYTENNVIKSSHDIVLMTCGNGTNDDSLYRLVLFATKIA